MSSITWRTQLVDDEAIALIDAIIDRYYPDAARRADAVGIVPRYGSNTSKGHTSSDQAPQSAGGRLMADLDAVLAEAAATAANRREVLQRQLDAEVAGENRPEVVVRLSAESITDHLGRVHIGPGVAKSQRHQRAVNARWDRRRDAQ